MRQNTVSGIRCRAVGLRLLMAAAVGVTGIAQVAAQKWGGGMSCGDCVSGACDLGGCDSGCCGTGFGGSGYGNDVMWIGADYLLWQLRGDCPLPPLVTASPVGTPLEDAGQLGSPTTQVLSGRERVGDDWRSGFRVYGGIWLDPCSGLGIGGDYFNTGRDTYRFNQGSDPNLIVTRPFLNTESGAADAQLVSVPGELDGTVKVRAYDELQGAGINLQQCLWRCADVCSCCSSQVSVLGGYRFYQYDSFLSVNENLTVLQGTSTPLIPGTNIMLSDEFRARNEFHGGDIGLQGRIQKSWWWIEGMAKVAVGNNRRTVTIDGTTVNTVPNVGTESFEGGLLTSEATNIGRYTDNRTAVIPELRFGVGGHITERISARAGYNVIYWGNVARAASHLPPGLEVDPRNLPPIDPNNPGGPAPLFPGITGSDLIAHGFDFGLQLDY